MNRYVPVDVEGGQTAPRGGGDRVRWEPPAPRPLEKRPIPGTPLIEPKPIPGLPTLPVVPANPSRSR